MRGNLLFLGLIVTYGPVGAQMAAGLSDDEERALLGDLANVAGVGSIATWKIDYYEPGYARVVYSPSQTGTGDCIAPVVTFEKPVDGKDDSEWVVNMNFDFDRRYWIGSDSCEGLELSDSIYMRDLVDTNTLRSIASQSANIIAAVRDKFCPYRVISEEGSARLTTIGLRVDERDGVHYRVSVAPNVCDGASGAYIRLVDGEVSLIEAILTVE